VLSTGGSIGGPGVDFRDVGTELQFLPIVLGNGRIYLEVSPRFRAINQGRGIQTSFGFVPGFDEQSVRTAIEMEDGQTFAIGGLIQTTVQATSSRVPVLGAIPFLGTAFSTVSYIEEEDELVILVTPHLVDAQDCNQTAKRLPGRETRSPDDFELFLEGILEAPRGQRQVFENGQYKAAYKNDPSIRQFPCADPLPRQYPLRSKMGCGNCAPGGTPGQLPAGVHNDPMMPSGNGEPNLKIVPDRETLPPPKPTGDLPAIRIGSDPTTRGGPLLPDMPAPPGRNDDRRN
jgi:pilus assembly protein CpaC